MNELIIASFIAAGILMGMVARVTILLFVCLAILAVTLISIFEPTLHYSRFPLVLLAILQVSYLFGAALPHIVSPLFPSLKHSSKAGSVSPGSARARTRA